VVLPKCFVVIGGKSSSERGKVKREWASWAAGRRKRKRRKRRKWTGPKEKEREKRNAFKCI
jgi:hypothetical protein